jgi:hypothetical protein
MSQPETRNYVLVPINQIAQIKTVLIDKSIYVTVHRGGR